MGLTTKIVVVNDVEMLEQTESATRVTNVSKEEVAARLDHHEQRVATLKEMLGKFAK